VDVLGFGAMMKRIRMLLDERYVEGGKREEGKGGVKEGKRGRKEICSRACG
jgi:hypothetical protein